MSQPETSKTPIYFDYAASASDSQFAVSDGYANPNSINESGRESFEVLEKAREDIMKIVGAKRPSEIIFTSSATEANNMAILGIARAVAENHKFEGRNKIIVFALEHESSLLPAKALKNEGFDVQVLESDRNGFAKVQKFMTMCDQKTALVVIQHANTEIGSIQNIKQLATIAHENGAYFHSDCVGSFGNISLNVTDKDIDSASFSGHKIGAPKGIGALYLKSGTPIVPIMYGGHQENGISPGTQAVGLAKAFAEAAKYSELKKRELSKTFSEYIRYLVGEVSKIDGVRLTVGFPENKIGYIWNIISLTYDNFSSKELILKYGKHGIIVSGGPACSAQKDEPSHVLQAIKAPANTINNVIRLSFGESTSLEDLKYFVEVTKKLLQA